MVVIGDDGMFFYLTPRCCGHSSPVPHTEITKNGSTFYYFKCSRCAWRPNMSYRGWHEAVAWWEGRIGA